MAYRTNALRQPSCVGCPYNYYYHDPIPKPQQGITMHLGERFCTGGKKAHRFKKSDPKRGVPSWCPKRKNPCEVRIYIFKSANDRLMHLYLSEDPNNPLYPSAHRCAIAAGTTIGLTPQVFWERCQSEPPASLMGRNIPFYSIVEIDDGLMPVFFYLTPEGVKIMHHFDAARAQSNKREGMD